MIGAWGKLNINLTHHMLPLRSQKGNATQVDLFEAEKKTFVNKEGKSIFYMVVMSCFKDSKGAERHGKDWRGTA